MARPDRGPDLPDEDLTAPPVKSRRVQLVEERKLYDPDKARLEASRVLTAEPPSVPKRTGIPLWVYVVLLVAVCAVGVFLIARAAFRPVLEEKGFTWGETGDGHHVEARGRVKNVTRKDLQSVTAVVTFRDRKGSVIVRTEALVADSPLKPGQTSSFWVTETYVPAMHSAVVEFAFPMGGTIPTRHVE